MQEEFVGRSIVHALREDHPNTTASPMRIRRNGDTRDIVHIAFDPKTRLIRAYAGGCWTVEETDDYISALTNFVEDSRSRIGKARVLLDRRDVGSQCPMVATMLAEANGTIFQTDDRIALVIASSITKASLRQRMPHAGTKAFLSIDAAETWLRAFDSPRCFGN